MCADGAAPATRRCAGPSRHTERHPDASLRLCPDCSTKLWPKVISRRVRFHDLRHPTVALPLRTGIDPHPVQRILRPQDIRTTTGTRGHLLVEDLRSAVESLGLPKAADFAPPLRRPPAQTEKSPEPEVDHPSDSRAFFGMRPEGFEPPTLGFEERPQRYAGPCRGVQARAIPAPWVTHRVLAVAARCSPNPMFWGALGERVRSAQARGRRRG